MKTFAVVKENFRSSDKEDYDPIWISSSGITKGQHNFGYNFFLHSLLLIITPLRKMNYKGTHRSLGIGFNYNIFFLVDCLTILVIIQFLYNVWILVQTSDY